MFKQQKDTKQNNARAKFAHKQYNIYTGTINPWGMQLKYGLNQNTTH